MDMRQLETFVAVADAGSFSRAAAVQHLAQPSLSRQIALLEADLGQRLFVRTGRGVALTDAGAALLVHARQMLGIARQARDELGELGGSPSGRVVVGLPPRVALGLSAPLVQRFRAQFPRAVISVLEGLSVSLRESLVAGRLDLALLFDPPASPQLRYTTLMRERLMLVGPPGARLPARVGLSALPRYPMVLPSAPNAIRSLVDGALAQRRVALDVIAEVGAVQTVLTLVAQGVGHTLLPESAVAGAAPSIPRAPVGPPAIWNTLVLATPLARPATRLTRATGELLRTLDFRRAGGGAAD